MSLPQTLEGASCEELVRRWEITPELAARLLTLSALWLERFGAIGSLSIVSGYRTREEQAALEREGRPAAQDKLSTHRSCPATGADLRLPLEADAYTKAELGRLVYFAGLRWGGGSPRDVHGMPTDWNHVDLGPRASSS